MSNDQLELQQHLIEAYAYVMASQAGTLIRMDEDRLTGRAPSAASVLPEALIDWLGENPEQLKGAGKAIIVIIDLLSIIHRSQTQGMEELDVDVDDVQKGIVVCLLSTLSIIAPTMGLVPLEELR